jgi:hypothetical protein
MKNFESLGEFPLGVPLTADEITEFHAARILMLIAQCGISGRRIEGLTKLAKLDFLLRYPHFLAELLGTEAPHQPAELRTESRMIRHHYGPWDPRYYAVLGYLESRGLLFIARNGARFDFELTEVGRILAKQFSEDSEFFEINQQLNAIKSSRLHQRTGNKLKSMIYEQFGREVVDLGLGDVIA